MFELYAVFRVEYCFCVCYLIVAFNMYDLDGDNMISREELLSVLHMMVGANISEEQVSGEVCLTSHYGEVCLTSHCWEVCLMSHCGEVCLTSHCGGGLSDVTLWGVSLTHKHK